ncbi:MAG: succinate dehydrogenase, hydrophobic membrane anchor protein [Burkholderiaceae bacterium]|jgi:succinate dehydrogenase / fumarate reductase membrane anchor subunit
MEKIGSKRLVVGAHYGLKDWLLQRLTAVVLALYTVYLVVGRLLMPEGNYVGWVRLFNFECIGIPLGKVLALLALFSLFYHAWVGMRDIWMDYIKHTGWRLGAQVFSGLWLIGCAVYAVQIIGRI